MKWLVYDFMQDSDAPSTMISPRLSSKYTGTSVDITLSEEKTFDCVGIGNTDATTITIAGQTITISDPSPYPDAYKNGLYMITSTTAESFTISHNGTYLGRVAIGKARTVGCAPAREPGGYTTSSNRVNISGGIIPGAGGISGRKISLDFRYKIDEDFFSDWELALQDQISKNFPFFVYFDKETSRMPWTRLYASIDDIGVFQSSVNYFLYSKKFTFTERY